MVVLTLEGCILPNPMASYGVVQFQHQRWLLCFIAWVVRPYILYVISSNFFWCVCVGFFDIPGLYAKYLTSMDNVVNISDPLRNCAHYFSC